MKRSFFAAVLLFAAALNAEVPSNLVVENVPEFPPALVETVKPYLDSRTAAFAAWHPTREEMLIRTRFGDATQLHSVKMPGGDRRQLTFFDDAVSGGSFRPGDPTTILFSKDVGGSEFFQLYRYDVPTGAIKLLTDGKSRNTGGSWSRDGKLIAFSSTRRTGRDTDIWVMDPMDAQSARMVMKVDGGGWGATDFSRDNTRLIVVQGISANETNLFLVDVATGSKTPLTKKGSESIAYSGAEFSADDSEIFFTSDEANEFKQLRRMRLAGATQKILTTEKWDVDGFTLSDDRQKVAYSINEDGANKIRILDLKAGKVLAAPELPWVPSAPCAGTRRGSSLAFHSRTRIPQPTRTPGTSAPASCNAGPTVKPAD